MFALGSAACGNRAYFVVLSIEMAPCTELDPKAGNVSALFGGRQTALRGVGSACLNMKLQTIDASR